MPDVSQRVKTITSDTLGVDLKDVRMWSNFQDDLNADSLDLIQLAMALVGEFNIDISDTEAEKIKTVEDAVAYIEAKTKR